MAKKKEVPVSCGSEICACPSWFGWSLLVIGVLYLLGDLFGNLWIFGWFANTFSWWTVAFVLLGLKKVCKTIGK